MPSDTCVLKKQKHREHGIDTNWFLSNSVFIDTFQKFQVFLVNKTTFYVGEFIKNKFFPVIYLEVTNISRKKISVDMIYVTEKHRGKNLAMKFYKHLIVYNGYTIVSGGSQSPGGKSIWISLSKQKGVDIRLGQRDYSMRKSPIRFVNGKYKIPYGSNNIIDDVFFIASADDERELYY